MLRLLGGAPGSGRLVAESLLPGRLDVRVAGSACDARSSHVLASLFDVEFKTAHVHVKVSVYMCACMGVFKLRSCRAHTFTPCMCMCTCMDTGIQYACYSGPTSPEPAGM